MVIIGIDLGTTNSLVSVFRDGENILIPNALGHFLTPSEVCIKQDGSVLVGLPAREYASARSGVAASGFKRMMGSDHLFKLGDHSMRAEELSSLVIRALKDDVENFLGDVVTEAVITVPAYFNDAQRRATKIAGELAGLKVERLLNEPTAAGLAYGLQERIDHTTFLIFDLGGGTFDVSVLTYFEGIVEVRASAGDTQLGGNDFVEVIVNWFLEKNPELSKEDRESILIEKSLWRAAEQAKRDLSKNEVATLSFSVSHRQYELVVTSTEFETRCESLLKRLRKPIEQALLDARLDLGELDEVVMVGGASRMPMVRQMVARIFGRLPLRTINPDETIARGAAILAAMKMQDRSLQEIVLTDVMPYSLGIIVNENVNHRSIGNRFSPIIERNTSVPISCVKNYSTVYDNQMEIKIDIRQGESPIGSENIQLGVMDLPMPWGLKSGTVVQVRFTYDINGILEVDANVPVTGNAISAVFVSNSESMTSEYIASALEKIKKLKIHPRDAQENIYLVERAKRLYANFLGEERQALAQALIQFELVLDSQDEQFIRPLRARFKEYLDSMDRGFVL